MRSSSRGVFRPIPSRVRPMSKSLLLVCGLLAGCAGQAPEVTYYLLRVDPGSHGGGPAAVGLGRVAVAGYLDQSGILVQTGPNQVEAARYHRWAEPLNQGIRSLMRDALADAMDLEVARSGNGSRFVVDLYIDRLHGSVQGDVVIVADVAIVRGNDTAASFRFTAEREIERDGYAALVAAETDLVIALAERTASSLQDLLGDRATRDEVD